MGVRKEGFRRKYLMAFPSGIIFEIGSQEFCQHMEQEDMYGFNSRTIQPGGTGV